MDHSDAAGMPQPRFPGLGFLLDISISDGKYIWSSILRHGHV